MDTIERAILMINHLYHSAYNPKDKYCNIMGYVSSLSEEEKKNLISNLPAGSIDEKDSIEENIRKTCCVIHLICKYFNSRECNQIFRNPETVNHLMNMWYNIKGDMARFLACIDMRQPFVLWARSRIPQEELQELLSSNVWPSTHTNVSAPEKVQTRRKQGNATLERAFNAVCRQAPISNPVNNERASDRHTQQSSVPQNLIPQTAIGGMAVRQAVGNRKNFARSTGEAPTLTIDQMSALMGFK